jgi:hypothetical protein
MRHESDGGLAISGSAIESHTMLSRQARDKLEQPLGI